MSKLVLTRALVVLLFLTISVAVGSVVLPNTARMPALAVFAAVTACLKARLVILDFIGLRSDPTPLRSALMGWAIAIIVVAATKTIAIATMFAN